MSRIINVDANKNIIDFVADYILRSDKKFVVISGGKRPFLFIKRNLAQELGKAFFSPGFYTNDEFVEQSIFKKFGLVKISDIEAAYLIYKIIKDEEPRLLKGKTSFASFMEWSQEIFSFIEQLDLENVSEEKLKAVRANAEIGYDVPENINNFLKNIFKIRKSFHAELDRSFRTTKGYSFFKAAELDCFETKDEFEEIILLAPFYLHKTEFKIFKKFYDNGNLTVIVQGDPREFDILETLYREFREIVPDIKPLKNSYELNIYSTVDDQSQGSCLKNLVSSYSEDDLNKTVVIVAEPKMLQSVVSELSIVTEKYNVSAGYPAEKSAVFMLVNEIVEAQLSRRGECYYSKDFVKVLTNPFFKNMKFFRNSVISGIVAHKIEEALSSDSNESLSGKAFVSFKEIIEDKDLISNIEKNILGMCEYLHLDKIIKILNEIFECFFGSWERIKTFLDLSNVIFNFLNKLYSMSDIGSYPLNIEAMDIFLSMSKEMKYGEVAKVKFKHEEIFAIFKKFIKNKKIPLPGSPLKGLQVLGLLESRNLSFDNVFIVGMTDSAIPAVKKDYSLVPKDIIYALGIEMIHKEYEIQKYHFSRLIARSKKLSLIYSDSAKKERSRFIESIIWEKQFESRDLNTVKINRFILPKFSIKKTLKQKYAKTQEVKKYLKSMSYTYSKIDSYLTCRLKFYFQYVLSLDNKIEISSDVSTGDIGNFIHNFLKEVFYENLNFKVLKTEKFEKDFFEKFNNKFNSSSRFQFREDAFLIKEVFKHRMEKVLEKERQRDFKSIYICEKKYNSSIQIDSGDTYKLNCIIDRVDNINDKEYAIFDYKTGYISHKLTTPDNFNKLKFKRQTIKKYVKSLQLPTYKYIFEKETGLKVMQCGLYNIKKAEIINFPTQQYVNEKCIDTLKFLLNEINSGDYFVFDEEDEINCKTCKYFYICG
ncbi:MAG: PD-(D/E)XK nuclease family protein [Endomicrobium sp.]|jgi:CRISPR/Cas system-associated exonuclease Cas4 (RecB family)|nr:PD-(D/E)XK nuclease family protein [Endomicrobium sp.]